MFVRNPQNGPAIQKSPVHRTTGRGLAGKALASKDSAPLPVIQASIWMVCDVDVKRVCLVYETKGTIQGGRSPRQRLELCVSTNRSVQERNMRAGVNHRRSCFPDVH